MTMLISYIPLLVVLAVVAVIFIVITQRRSKGSDDRKNRLAGKDRATILRETNRRLSQNPRDAEALIALAGIHFADGEYEKSMKEYEILIGMCATNPALDEYEITVKYALSAMNSGHEEEAYGSLIIAYAAKNDGFDVNFNLGYLEYKRKNYEKAITYLSQARVLEADHPGTLKYLGHSLFGGRRFAEAATILRKAIELAPDDKESLFALARSYHELGHEDQALKIFSHLRTDPTLGPHAALFSGTIHLKTRQYDLAVTDFQIGLRHEAVAEDVALELKYRLAATLIRQQKISEGLVVLQEIDTVSPEYRDVQELIGRYRELSLNENLQVYLISQTSEFVTLCRKMVMSFLSDAKVKVTDISVQRIDFADILAEATTPKTIENVLFRFVRSTGNVGELIVRDFYSHLKDVRAARGYCVVAGSFTEGAREFVEGRPVDLVEKDELTRKLARLGN